MKSLLTFLTCWMLLVSVCAAQDFKYSFREKYNISVPAQLSISSADGDIAVESFDGNEIQVYYIVRKGINFLNVDKAGLEKEAVILEIEQDRNSLKIKVRRKDVVNNFFDSRNQIAVSFKVYVPRQTACNLHTSDGNIHAQGLTSNQEYGTSDGNISVSDVKGNVTGSTSDGDIGMSDISGDVNGDTSDGNVSVKKIHGKVSVGTSDGNIDLTDVTGDVSARTSDGHIGFTDLSGSFKGVTSDGNIHGNLLKLERQLTASTGDGNINVTIPDHLGLDLNIHGESLDVPLNNFSGKSEKKFIKGQSNGGGIPVDLSTSDGNVTIAYLK